MYSLLPFQTRIILAFTGSTNKREISQIAGDLKVSSSLLSLNSIALCLNKCSKTKLELSICHMNCWINGEVYQITNIY